MGPSRHLSVTFASHSRNDKERATRDGELCRLRYPALVTSTRWFGAALLGLASCVCACSAEPESVWLSLPDADGAATMLLGLRERDGVRVFVADAEEGARRTIIDEALSRTSAESIEVAFFDRSMSQAELTEGWLTAALPSQSRAHLVGNGAILGQPIERFVAQPFDRPPVWAPANSLSSELLGFCRDFHQP